MLRRLLNPDPAEGTPPADPKPDPIPEPTAPAPDPIPDPKPPAKPLADPKPASPSATPPPAAKVVLEGTKTEREIALERDKEKLSKTLKDREVRIAEQEDELRALKTPPPSPPVPEAKAVKRSWLSGGTFFDDGDE